MRYRLFLLIGVSIGFLPMLLDAQFIDSTSAPSPDFQLMRSTEDYSHFKNKSSNSNLWEQIKYLSTGPNSYLSVGGDFRSEFQILSNEDWTNGRNDQPIFIRLMLHTDWHWRQHFRLFAQLKSGYAIGRNGPELPLNVDRVDWHQLFVAFKLGASTIEIGRRELVYGTRRLISLREGTNIRQSFDGLRWIWQKPGHRLDILAYAYNPQRTGVFDNSINTDRKLWGGYYVWQIEEDERFNFDIYYLGVDNDMPLFEEGIAQETRHSFGIRHWGRLGPFQYNHEAIFQSGKFGDGQIRAWTISTEMYYHFPGSLALKTGLKAEIISGDEQAGDGQLQTFNPLYPRGGYFGLLALLGPANLMDIHPSLHIKPLPKLVINLDWDAFWRHRIEDGIYFPSGRLNLAGSGSTERFIGHQPGLQVGYTINRFVEVATSYFYFFPGPFVKAITPGAGFSQFGVSLGAKF